MTDEMLPPERFCQVTTMYPSREGADELAELVVHQRIAAAVHVEGPVTARFWWDGGVNTVEEWRVTVKTTSDRVAQVREQIRSHHPYVLPEFLVLPIAGGSPRFLEWMAAETETAGRPWDPTDTADSGTAG